MIFSFEETDDFEGADNFDDEPEDSYFDEEDADVVGLEDDLDDAATALSHAFREATAAEVVEEEEDEEEEDEKETVEEPEDEKAVEETSHRWNYLRLRLSFSNHGSKTISLMQML